MLDQIFETVKIFENASDLSPRPEMLSITISLSNTTFSPKQVSLQGDTFLKVILFSAKNLTNHQNPLCFQDIQSLLLDQQNNL